MTEPIPPGATAAKTAGKQRGRPFKPGESGNPTGRPEGSMHRATKAALALLDGDAEKLTRAAIDKALEGDTTALRLCLERIVPTRKDRPLTFKVGKVTGPDDAFAVMGRVIEEMGEGELAPSEAAAVLGVVNGYLDAWKATDLDRRMRDLEEQQKRATA